MRNYLNFNVDVDWFRKIIFITYEQTWQSNVSCLKKLKQVKF